jgi:hypothetical protein
MVYIRLKRARNQPSYRGCAQSRKGDKDGLQRPEGQGPKCIFTQELSLGKDTWGRTQVNKAITVQSKLGLSPGFR